MAQGKNKPEGVKKGDKFAGGKGDPSIMKNLEAHLNQLPPQQKQFLTASLQHYSNIVIPVLGIVCGQEVFQYFLNIYKQNFAQNANTQQQGGSPTPQQNSAQHAQAQQPNSSPQPPQGQTQPQQAPPQQQAAPQQ